MKRIENHVSAIKDAARKYFLGGDDAGILQLCGGTGMGKTAAARHYVKIHGGYYFSFRHLDAAIAPQIFLPGSRDWDAFFKIIAKKKIARSSFLMTRTIGTIRIFSSVSFPPCTGKPLSCCFVGEK